MVEEILTDPASHLLAAVLGWAYPVSREWIMLANHLDTFVQANSAKGKAKPIRRPWDLFAKKPGKIDPELKAILRRNAGRG